MAPHYFDGLQGSVRSSSDGSTVAFGFVIDGHFFPFHWMPAGGFEDDLATVAADVGQYVSGPEQPAA